MATAQRQLSPEERERLVEQIVAAGGSRLFLAEAKKRLSPDEWELLRKSVAECERPEKPARNRGCLIALIALILFVLAGAALVLVFAFSFGMAVNDPALKDPGGIGIGPGPYQDPSVGAQPVGTSQKTGRGNTVTVYALEYDSGHAVAAADVELCATSAEMADTEFSRDFTVLPLGNILRPPFRDPDFPEARGTLPLGSCVRGWIGWDQVGKLGKDQPTTQVVVTWGDYEEMKNVSGSFGLMPSLKWK